MPSLQAFQEATNIGLTKGRRDLEQIDLLLRAWVMNPPATGEARLEHLGAVIAACDKWTGERAQKISKGSNKRRGQVQALRIQASERQRFEHYMLFDLKKRRGGFNPTRVPLQPGYSVERTQFEQQRADLRNTNSYGKDVTISPIGGSHVNFVHELHPKVQKLFGNLTPDDFKLYENIEDDSAHSLYVHFMRKQERLGHMLVVYKGSLMQRGVLFSTGSAMHLYVMDLYGNLFVRDSRADYTSIHDALFQYNHSSLNAGKDVICAGTIVVNNGVLREITNESGHYAPTAGNLAECLAELVNDGLDVSFTNVVVVTADGPTLPQPAASFLANTNVVVTPPPLVPTSSAAPPVPAWVRATASVAAPSPAPTPVIAPAPTPVPTAWVRASSSKNG